jgi:hypothetical protein
MRLKIVTRRSFVRLAILGLVVAALAVVAYFVMIKMPGTSYAGPLPALTETQRHLADELSQYVHHLAGEPIGERNLDRPDKLDEAVQWLSQTLADMGYEVRRQEFDVAGQLCVNLDVELPGSSGASEVIVVGAHYDTVPDCPGANDNGTGVAATLALARRFAGTQPKRTLCFALFTNEEPPYFQTSTMGSVVYANACKARGDHVLAMFSMETIGCYSDAPGSQQYPPILNLVYPSTGNFIAFVGNLKSRALVRETVRSFRELAQFPSEGGAVPGWMTGVGWSDHWAFWQAGYSAVMVTDTAPFRYPHYHRASDTPDKIDYQRTARVVEGMALVIERMANAD